MGQLRGSLPRSPIEPAELWIAKSDGLLRARVCAPPAVRPCDIVIKSPPSRTIPGNPLRLRVSLAPSYPASTKAEARAALDMVAANLQASVVGVTSESASVRLRTAAPTVDEEATHVVIAVLVPSPHEEGLQDVCFETLHFVGEPVALVRDGDGTVCVPLRIPVGAAHDDRPEGLAWAAAESGDVAGLVDALCAGCSTEECFMRGTCLHIAARRGHLGAVRVLLTAGAAVNVTAMESELRRTPMMVATAGGHASIVRLLLDAAGVYVSACDVSGDSCLSIAASECRVIARSTASRALLHYPDRCSGGTRRDLRYAHRSALSD